MTYGWVGSILRINLTGRAYETEPTEKYANEFLGGKGINAKILWDGVSPEIKPLDPKSLLIFGTGPLTGTIVPGSGEGSVTCKSPTTGIFNDSGLAGFWPAELKFAGYDHLVLVGCADEPAYILINDGCIDFRDAKHLWGKDTLLTTQMIKNELAGIGDDIQVICIGPAGENKVYSASITHEITNSASRGGVGAVMGSKNLKAVAVRGTHDIAIARKKELIKLCKEIRSKSEGLKKISTEQWETLRSCGEFMTFGTMDEIPPPGTDFDLWAEKCKEFLKDRRRLLACFNCPAACKHYFVFSDFGPALIHCESWNSWDTRSKNLDGDFAFNAKLATKCQKLGLDIMSVANFTGFLMDLYEKGVVTKKDTDGIPMEWGNKEVMDVMADKVARREGCGELFAEGLMKAAQKIGKGAQECAHQIKRMDIANYSLYNKYVGLSAAISERGEVTKTFSITPLVLLGSAPKELKELLKKDLPEDLLDALNKAYEGKAKLVEFFERANNLADFLGVCKWMVHYAIFGIMPLDTLANLFSLTLGKDVRVSDLNVFNERICHLIRSFNVREGVTKEEDITLPNKYFKMVSPRYGYKLDRDKFKMMVDEYYQLRGWDENGIPKRERLEALNLKYVLDDLKNRKIG